MLDLPKVHGDMLVPAGVAKGFAFQDLWPLKPMSSEVIFFGMWKGTGCPSDLGNEAMKPYMVMVGIHSPHSLLRAYPGFSLQSLLTQVWRMHHPLIFVVRSALRQDK